VLTIAIPKGRPFGPTVRLLRQAVLCGPELTEEAESRALLIESPERQTRFLIARPTDVPTYVEHGAADLGIVGKDVLLEGQQKVYELLDLGYSRCRFILAAPAGFDHRAMLDGSSHLRVATKYPRMTEEHFKKRGLQAEIIYLNGSIEAAPKVGLADMVVDITETGRTLRENNLVIVEELWTSTMRLIANRASYRLKSDRIGPLTQRLRDLTRTGSAGTGVRG
jgi:ATP phosphoribosyltransferase